MAMKKRFSIGEVSREDIVHQWRKQAGVKLSEACVKKISDKDMKIIAGDMGDSVYQGVGFWSALELASMDYIKKCRV